MDREIVVKLRSSFEAMVRKHDETGTEFWCARDLQTLLDYDRWENFDNLVRRAQNLIATGEANGLIVERARKVAIGSGAVRSIIDYELDEHALLLLERLSTGFKLNGYYPIRNECVLLRLVEKYCKAKGIKFEFQPKRAGVVFDAVVDERIAVEFDEPHHEGRRQSLRDAEKDRIADSLGLTVVRFDLGHDVIDMILTLETMLFRLTRSEKELSGIVFDRLRENQSFARIRSKGDTALFGGRTTQDMKNRLRMPKGRPLADFLPTITIKAKDFANEITNFNIKEHDLRAEPVITDEHVKNNQEVRKLLVDRGIVPERLPAAEDVKKVERRLASERKKLPKQVDRLEGGGQHESE